MFSVASAVMLFSLHTDICKEIVSEAKDDEFDMNTCESVYLSSAWIVTLAMAINMLLKVCIHLNVLFYIGYSLLLLL